VSGAFPQGPRSLRLRRSITAGSDFSVFKGFQVVTAMDLDFLPNATTDSAPVYEGRREEVVYGVCMPLIGFAAAISCVFCLITCAFAFCFVMICRLNRFKRRKSSPNH